MIDPSLLKEFQNWKNMLTQEEKSALLTYTSDMYEDINEALRENDSERCEEIIKLIDSALNKYILSMNINVYRYEGEETFTMEEKYEAYSIVLSETYLYENYISTSLTTEGAEEYLAYLKELKNFKSFKYINAKVKKGMNCGFLDCDLSYSSLERELLLMKGTFLKYEEVKKRNETTIEIKGEFYKV